MDGIIKNLDSATYDEDVASPIVTIVRIARKNRIIQNSFTRLHSMRVKKGSLSLKELRGNIQLEGDRA